VFNSKFPPEAFYRLLCTDYLPESVERVLYLDSDIIINGSLDELWGIDLTDYMFAAAVDAHNLTKDLFFYKQRIGLPIDVEYVNSGVLLMNLGFMRAAGAIDEVIKQAPAYRLRLQYPDQDMINLLFHDYILHIDRHMYNNSPAFNDGRQRVFQHGCPVVIHFYGATKPWEPFYPTNGEIPQKVKKLYDFYAALSVEM
jgi:lipopolysaccharide biosynthesis glycosyltransferase